MADQYGHPIKTVTKFTIDASGDWQKLQAAFAAPNPLYAEHFAHMGAAARSLEAMPKATKVTEGGDTKVDTGSVRKSRKS